MRKTCLFFILIFSLMATVAWADAIAHTLSPTDGSTVSTTANLVVTFPGAAGIVANGAKQVKLMQPGPGFPIPDTEVEILAANAANISLIGNQVAIDPTNPLSDGTDYYVLIDNGAFTVDGTSWDGLANATDWNFTGVTGGPASTTPLSAIGIGIAGLLIGGGYAVSRRKKK